MQVHIRITAEIGNAPSEAEAIRIARLAISRAVADFMHDRKYFDSHAIDLIVRDAFIHADAYGNKL